MAADFTRSIAADIDRLPALLDSIESWLGDNGVPTAEAVRIMIAFDEILSNIVDHGGGAIDVAIGIADAAMHATISDDGPPFDPLARAAPDTDAGLDDRAIGGLGIHLVRTMMDDVAYGYRNGRNRLTFRKTF